MFALAEVEADRETVLVFGNVDCRAMFTVARTSSNETVLKQCRHEEGPALEGAGCEENGTAASYNVVLDKDQLGQIGEFEVLPESIASLSWPT